MSSTHQPPAAPSSADPFDAARSNEAEVRDDVTAVFDRCDSCRRCVDRCGVFPSLFELLDHGAVGGRRLDDAAMLTPAQQDGVIAQCFQCGACVDACPYAPETDVALVVQRVRAMQRSTGLVTRRERFGHRLLTRTDGSGVAGSVLLRPVRRLLRSEPGSLLRRVVARSTGLSARRPFRPFAPESFTRWFERRPTVRLGRRVGTATVFPTCFIDAFAPDVAADLVVVLERNGVECSNASVGCCGAASLAVGDVRRFRRTVAANVSSLADAIRSGGDLVVPSPRCAAVLRDEYVRHASPADVAAARFVAENTFDATDHLVGLHHRPDAGLDLDRAGPVPDLVVEVPSCEPGRDGPRSSSRDLLGLMAVTVETVSTCPGCGPWSALEANDAAHEERAAQCVTEIDDAIERWSATAPSESRPRRGAGTRRQPGDPLHRIVITSESIEVADEVAQRTGREAVHPVTVLARACGIATRSATD
ncbi:MAG: heterodisulfide reductase-related iron-sulfur binding cluster [Actinomycetota bacterium]